MKLINLIFIVSFARLGFTQNNTIWIGHSLTKANQDFTAFNAPSLNNILTFGAGISVYIEHDINKSKTSSILSGIELSSVRQGFYLNSISNYATNTSIKIPILYGFKLPLSKHLSAFINLGVNFQLMFGDESITNIWYNSTKLELITKNGIYPLIHFNFGIEKTYKTNKKFNIVLGINKGFINFEEITYTTTNPSVITKSQNNGTYYEIKFNWKLNFRTKIFSRK